MAEAEVIDVGRLVDEQKVSAFSVIFLAVSLLVLTAYGYDLFVIGMVGPELVKSWHIGRASLGPVLSASELGIIIGAPLFGYLGDRFGRKTIIIASSLFYALCSFLSASSASINELTWLRLATGFGLGGTIPNMIALAAEFAPKRLRGRYIVIVSFGPVLGSALTGVAAAWLVKRYGWPVLFKIGGVLPLLMIVPVLFFLPESIKFLVLKGKRDEEVRRTAVKLGVRLFHAGSSRFVVSGDDAPSGASPAKLFAGGLRFITPLLWLSFATSMLAAFFMANWLPTLLQSEGANTQQAALAVTMLHLGGLLGGVAMTLLVDRFGVVPITVLFWLAAPLSASLGLATLSVRSLWFLATCAGFCGTGVGFGMNALSGMIYPTSVRSLGGGWAVSASRIGAISGPLLGGVLVGRKLSFERLLFAPAIALAIGAVASIFLARFCIARFRGFRLDDAAAPIPERSSAPGAIMTQEHHVES